MPKDDERIGPFLIVANGRKFWPLDPRPEDIEIKEIIVPLSNKVRFNGTIALPYTVGMHTLVGVKECLRRWPEDYATALKFFLHDAGEAYGPDIASPLKSADLGVLNESEDKILAVIGSRFGIQGDIMTDKVIEIDLDSLKTEFGLLMPHTPDSIPGNYSRTIAMDAERMLDSFMVKPWQEAVQRVRGELMSRFSFLMGKMG
jgi:hypothetical protein